jgi:chromosome segregation ATPase
MAEYAKIEARLAAALERAVRAAERLDGPDETALESLRAELAAEREATARLEARIRELTRTGEAATTARAELERARDSAASETAALREEVEQLHAALAETETLRGECERLQAALVDAGMEAERLRKTSAEVTAAMKVLREAQVADLVDAHLIDKAMKRELDALHAARDSERAEIEAIVAALGPLVGERPDA